MRFELNTKDVEKIVENTFCTDDVIGALSKTRLSEIDFLALLSDAADLYVEKIANKAKKITEERHGKVKGFYIPLYLSNVCQNQCSYCGFNSENKVKRHTLTVDEIKTELNEIYERGYRAILLVAGEYKDFSNIDFLKTAVELAKKRGFQSISVEFGALDEESSKKLVDAGADSFVLYQETYHPETYSKVHLKGKKADYDFRLQGFSRAINAGFSKVTLGFLAGLHHDYKYEVLSIFRHMQYLKKNFWDTTFCLSIPRLSAAEGAGEVEYPVSERKLLKILSAFRLAFPDMPILLSTRECEQFRDGMTNICVTHLSCESKTTPGGNATENDDLEQFEITDDRNLSEMVSVIKKMGFDPLFKDWQIELNKIEGC